ncbi:MAG: hypothetical protein JWN34_3630 [Bryobacterales bacterium]|nr:hypothetical protein [Bryobacterales bacterium]
MMVALTGIEWVSVRFSWCQSSLTSFVSVHLVQGESGSDPYRMRLCDPRVTARLNEFVLAGLPEVSR